MVKEIEVKIQLNNGEKITNRLRKLGDFGVKSKYAQTTYGFFSKDSVKKRIFSWIRIKNKKVFFYDEEKNYKKTKYKRKRKILG